MNDAFVVVPMFFSKAEEMRSHYDTHFSNPGGNAGPSHQIWDYWHVPDLYTYLRTDPARVLPPAILEEFRKSLQEWSLRCLGLGGVSDPYLSLYVDGCGQGLHNDSGNGRWGYVFSLTRWDERSFEGGETMLLKDTPYWDSRRFREPNAGIGFYDLIPARFNQLLVFDDRMIHAVRPLQGAMDPRRGRIVLHGHIAESGVHVNGPLSTEEVVSAFAPALADFKTRIAEVREGMHGFVSFRVDVKPEGQVGNIRLLCDRIARTSPQGPEPSALIDSLCAVLAKLQFANASSPTQITFPIRVG